MHCLKLTIIIFKILAKRKFQALLITLAISALTFVPQTFAAAGINKIINFQGKLVDNTGVNVTDGSRTVVFTLYDAASAGTTLWTESDTVTTTDGIFRVFLGGVTVFPGSVDFNTDNIYLGIKVGSDAEMTPRVQFTAVPYAFNALKVSGLTVTNTSGTLTIPNSKTISFAEAFTTSGANPLTLTTTGTTNVTLPTTGTLLTNTASAAQTLTSTQTIGTVLGITDATALSGAIKGLVVTLSGANAQDQTGLEFNLSNATGTNLNDIVGSGSTWKVSKAGALTVASCTGCGGGGATLQTAYNSATSPEITLDTTRNALTILNATADAISGNLLEVGNNANNTFYFGVTNSGSTFNANAVTTGTGLSISTAGLTSGNGLSLTAPDPKVNASAATNAKLTSGKLINIAATDGKNYMSLDNRDLTIGGHKNQITISNVQNVFVYDTTRDRDGGRWTSDERATSSSWYNESGSAASASPVTGAACSIGTNNRCGMAAFPDKAILVVAGAAGSNALYIFDAKDNSLWMAFNQNAGANAALGINANNTMSSVYGLNGNIYIGTNGSASTGAYEINFKTDKITRYNATDAEDFALGAISSRNVASGTAYVSQGRAAMAIATVTVNDVFAQIVNGKTYFVIADTGGASTKGVSVINETNQSVTTLGVNNKTYQSVFYTADDIIYGLNSTDSSVDAWYMASTLSSGTAASTTYSATSVPALWPTAPTINANAPDALFVTNGTSDADGQSNTIYVGNNAGMTGIEEKVGDETGGAVKYYTTNSITEEMFGDVRSMLPMAGTANVNAGVLLSGADLDASAKANGYTTKGTNPVTRIAGIRGKGMTFDGTNYLCTGTVANTCANQANVDVTTTNWSLSFWVKTVSNTTTRVLVNKMTTPVTPTAGYKVQINASHQLNSIATDGTTQITATSTRILDDNAWHFVAVVENRLISGSACNGAGNSCTLTQYIDGIVDGVSAANTTQTGSMTNATQMALMGDSLGANLTTGSMDEFSFTARTLTASQIQFMANVGYRALNNPNHTGATTIRNVSVAADGANALNGSTVVKAVNPLLDNGLIYIGTSGGVSVIGMYTDTLSDLYSTTINTKDDVNTNYDSTNGNAVNSVSVSKGYGMGIMIGIGFTNAGSGGLWAESNDTTFKDFLANSYNPFGNTLVQTNLISDRVFRVTNQISSRLDNFAVAGSAQPQLADLFRVDNNGAAIAVATEAINTNTAGTNSYKGLTISAINNITQNGAGGTYDFRAADITLPTITQTAGTVTADGLRVTVPSSAIVTNGTMNGINLPTIGTGPAAGTLNGINIGSITTPGAGTQNGLNIGSGWTSAIKVTDSQAVANTLVNLTTSNTGQTGNTLGVTTSSTGTVTAGLVRFNFNGIRTTAGNGLQIDDISTTLATVMAINGNSLTTGNGLVVSATATGLTGTALSVTTGSTGVPANGLVRFNFNGIRTAAGVGFQIDDISTTLATAMKLNANSLTTGNGLVVSATATGLTGNALSVTTGSTGVPTAGLVRFNFNGIRTAAGVGFQIDDISTTLATAMQLNANSLTSGLGLTIASSSTGITTAGANVGSLLNITESGAMTGMTGQLVSINASGTNAVGSTGSALNINLAGTAQLMKGITVTSATTAVTTDMMTMTYGGIATLATTNKFIRFINSGAATQGQISGTGTTGQVVYTATSDLRLKHNVTDTRLGLSDLMNIHVRDYVFNADPTNTVQTGFVAQELNGIYPEAVATNGDDGMVTLSGDAIPWSVDYGKVTPLLVKAIQDQQSLIVGLQTSVSGLKSTGLSSSVNTSNITTPTALNLSSLNVAGIATVSGELSADSLKVKNTSIFDGIVQVLESLTAKNLIVTNWARFLSDVIFKGEVNFEGRPTFNSDTAGFAIIKKDADSVDIIFDKEYAQTPLINLSITIDKITDPDPLLASQKQKTLEDTVLNGDVKYIVTRRTTKGFTIKLNKNAAEDIAFSWSALSIKDAKTAVGNPVIASEAKQSSPEPDKIASSSATPRNDGKVLTISSSPSP